MITGMVFDMAQRGFGGSGGVDADVLVHALEQRFQGGDEYRMVVDNECFHWSMGFRIA